MMEDLIIARLHHANHKNADGTHREILISKPLVFATYYSDADKSTHVVSTAGAIIPVVESPEDVAKACGLNITKENQNG